LGDAYRGSNRAGKRRRAFGDENPRRRTAELGDEVDAAVGAEGSGLGEVAGPTAMLLRGLAGAPVRRSSVAVCQRRRGGYSAVVPSLGGTRMADARLV